MGNAKHASGHWVVWEDDELNGCPFIPIAAADGGCIAEVVPDYSEDHPHLGERERATANLIAAAPEMLAALKDFVAPYAHLTKRQLQACAERETYGRVSPHIAVSVLSARAAIACGEGRDDA